VNLGLQLVAPEGFSNLSKDQRYYFLKTDPDPDSNRTVLAAFHTQESGRRVRIERIPTDVFHKGTKAGLILPSEAQLSLPPWLEQLEGMDIYASDLARSKAAKTNKSRAEQRYGYIEGLLPRLSEILLADNPFLIINEHARNTEPKQNRERLGEWLFAYVCHSFQIASLWPEYANVGCYDKANEKYNDTHFGRASLDKGKFYGWSSAMFSADIIKAVDGKLGKRLSKHQIYIDCLKEFWGCRARRNAQGDWEMYQPDGKPFPDTESKFWYRWYQHLDLRSTNIRLYGEHHARSKAGTKGSYSQNVCSLLSEMEVDAYFLKERPRLTHGDGLSARLCVARGVCVGSKNVVGVGFSLEGESASAYQMMLFCAAIGIEAFALLWGLRREAFLDVFLKGVPPHLISDRGKAPLAAIIGALMAKFPVREMTEAYSGRSKPNVESGHPRDKEIEGPPEYVVSDKDIIQLIQREICRAAKDNHVRYVGDLVIGKRAFDETVCSPYALAKALDDDGLNDAIQMHFDTAVRSYLPETIYTLRDGGFWLHDRCFSCKELDDGDLYPSLSHGQATSIKGYHLPLNLMWAWVEFRGQLYRLKTKLPVRLGEREKMVSMAELEIEAEIKRSLDSAQRRSAVAAELEAQARYEEYTRASWGDTSRKFGRPRKSPEATVEKRILVRHPTPTGKQAA
jgi:hypothetical protein